MTEIERFIFGGIAPEAFVPLVDKVEFHRGILTIGLVDATGTKAAIQLTFREVALTSIELDGKHIEGGPFDLVGFDSYRDSDEWWFVLNAGDVELGWRHLGLLRRLGTRSSTEQVRRRRVKMLVA